MTKEQLKFQLEQKKEELNRFDVCTNVLNNHIIKLTNEIADLENQLKNMED